MFLLGPVGFALIAGTVTALSIRGGAERGLERIARGRSEPNMIRQAAIGAGGVGLALIVLGSVFGGGWVAWAVRAVGVGFVGAGATAVMIDYELRATPGAEALLSGQTPGGGASP